MKTVKLTLDSQNNSDTFNVDGTLNSTSTGSRFRGSILESDTKFGYVNTSISVNFEAFPKENQEVLDNYVVWVKQLYKDFNTRLANSFSEMKEKLDLTL